MESSTIKVSTPKGKVRINTTDIIRLESASNYTYLFLKDKTKILTAKFLGLYENELTAAGFLRTHRAHLVNKLHICQIDEYVGITMSDNSMAGLSRRMKKDVFLKLGLN